MAISDANYKQALPEGYELDKYRLLRVLGVGGFGVTYLAEHLVLGHRVAIKEYLPNEFAVRDARAVHPKSAAEDEDFSWGLERFDQEARMLTRFRHPNLARVSDYVKANNTAYIVMDYEEGESLEEILARKNTLTEAQLRRIALPIADGLRQVHAAGYLHRDIKPGNIYVRLRDETPVLLDFGAARQDLGSRSRSMHAVASAGYSPMEQYESAGEQGPWTDIYSLSAVCYKAVTGRTPPEATRRESQLLRDQPDPLQSLSTMDLPGYSREFLGAVDAGLQVVEQRRPQSTDEWLALIEGAREPAGTAAVEAAPASDRTRESRGRAAPPPRANKSARRGVSRYAPAAAAAAVMIVMAAAAVAAWLFYAPRPAAVEAPAIEPGLPIAGGGGAMLVVETEPPGAAVLLDGERVGATPLRRIDLRAGTYDIAIRHPAYEEAWLDSQDLREGRVLTISESLLRGRGDLTVLAEPADAWVERDGARLADRTPVTLENIDAGEIFLTIGADGYLAEVVRFNVPKDDVGVLEHALRPIPAGTLTLRLEPADAVVSMPDSAPEYSPGMRLAEGEYQISVDRDGFVSSRLSVVVRGDTVERVVLARQPQPLSITVDPPGAVVEFIGRDEVYRDGMSLPPGNYPVRVSAAGFLPAELDIAHGAAPTRTEIALERAPQSFAVAATPPDAEVEFIGFAGEYRAGMALAPGEYRLRVSAPGHVTVEEIIVHGAEPTMASIELPRELPAPGERFRDCPLCPEMVALDSGRFDMGCMSGACDVDELPVRNVAVGERFALGRHEVTVAEFRAFVDATGYLTAAERFPARGCRTLELLERQRWDYTAGRNWRNQEYGLRDAQPVVCVNWHDARAFAEWLAQTSGEPYRLPSEAEWKYAARAGSRTRYHFGDNAQDLCDFANVADQTELPQDFAWGNPTQCSDGNVFPANAASYRPNAFGLHDMHGNVWEWVADCRSDNYASAPADGSPALDGDCGQRVMRGGSWATNAELNRIANRGANPAAESGSFLGFRVARSLLP